MTRKRMIEDMNQHTPLYRQGSRAFQGWPAGIAPLQGAIKFGASVPGLRTWAITFRPFEAI